MITNADFSKVVEERNALAAKNAGLREERNAAIRMAWELVQELAQKCDDPIHQRQLEELQNLHADPKDSDYRELEEDYAEGQRIIERFLETDREHKRLRDAAQAVIERWESPAWIDSEPTAAVIYRLRDILWPNASRQESTAGEGQP